MWRAWTAIFALVAVTACVAEPRNPAHTTIYTPAGAVDYHCPPGQAKKGRC